MSFSRGQTIKLDSDLQNFIEAEKEGTRFKRAVFDLNDICWDRCMHRVESDFSKVKGCFVNCVERFLDATTFILNKSQETFRKTIT